jgi:hypothetical protein
VVSPTTTTSYTVTGTSIFGCVDLVGVVSTVTVNAIPSLTVNSGAICFGESFTLTPSGASTYTYSSGTSVISPTTTTNYTVTGTSALGCVDTVGVVSTVTVNPNPIISLSASSLSICVGGISTLTTSGALSYIWSTGETSGSISVSPIINTTYSVTGFNSFGCSSDTSITIQSFSNPIINIGADIDIELGGNYQFNPIQFGAVSYSWVGSDYLNSTSMI